MAKNKLIDMTGVIVANYVTGNALGAGDLPALIKSVYDALANVDEPPAAAAEADTKKTPAQIRKSLADGSRIISFIDGKPYRLLKRHLHGHGMTPDDYRAKFGLPADYPVVSRDYSAVRSQLALSAGLGRGAAAKRGGRKPK
jgi:predicted transcriptional regulator